MPRRRDSYDPQDPGVQEFERLVTCERCGADVRALGLAAHQHSPLCELERTRAEMRAADWMPADLTGAEYAAVAAAGVPHTFAPAHLAPTALRDAPTSVERTWWVPLWAGVILATCRYMRDVVHDEAPLRQALVHFAASEEAQQALAVTWQLSHEGKGRHAQQVERVLQFIFDQMQANEGDGDGGGD